jgi:glycosyltransferase involved in cell wall biosynthesis
MPASPDAQTNGLRLPISCFIIARNEADRIGRTIASVRDLVSEIVVIDSGSTDGTQAIAEQAGARVIYNVWPGFGQQKRFGETQCQHHWLLNLDADEVVSPRLAQEIRAGFGNGEPKPAAFGMPALVVYPGQTKPRPLARDHFVYRLYDRRRANFKNDTLFDSVDVKGLDTVNLKGAIDHYSVRSLDHLIAKCDERAAYNANHAKTKSRGLLALRLVTEFPMSFFKYYLVRTHFTGGLMGFQYAMILAFYRFVRIVRMLAAQR